MDVARGDQQTRCNETARVSANPCLSAHGTTAPAATAVFFSACLRHHSCLCSLHYYLPPHACLPPCLSLILFLLLLPACLPVSDTASTSAVFPCLSVCDIASTPALLLHLRCLSVSLPPCLPSSETASPIPAITATLYHALPMLKAG